MSGGFAAIPTWLMKREDVSGPAKLVYAALAVFIDEDAQAFPAQKTLAAMAGCSVTRVKEALNELRSLGVLSWAPRQTDAGGQTSNLYRLAVHPAPSRRAPTPSREAATPQALSGYELDPVEQPLSSREGAPADAPPPAKKPRRKPTSALPADWVPSPAHREKAPPGVDVDVEAQKFRDHAAANDRRQVDWEAAFRLWLTRSAGYAASRPGAARPGGDPVPPEESADAWMYLGSGQPRKSYDDFREPGARTA